MMIKPELFDIVELLVNLPEHQQFIGSQGAIVDCYEDNSYEIEFSNDEGETTALCTLFPQQFIIVWQAKTKKWLSPSEKLNTLIQDLSVEKQQEVLDFALSLKSK